MKIKSAKVVEMELRKEKQLSIIDVREARELVTGKIPGAMNIPLSLLEFRLHEIDKATEHTIVCHSGARSLVAAKFLEYHGFKVSNMADGMLAWEGPLE